MADKKLFLGCGALDLVFILKVIVNRLQFSSQDKVLFIIRLTLFYKRPEQ